MKTTSKLPVEFNKNTKDFTPEDCTEFVRWSECKTRQQLRKFVPKGDGVYKRMVELDILENVFGDTLYDNTRTLDIPPEVLIKKVKETKCKTRVALQKYRPGGIGLYNQCKKIDMGGGKTLLDVIFGVRYGKNNPYKNMDKDELFNAIDETNSNSPKELKQYVPYGMDMYKRLIELDLVDVYPWGNHRFRISTLINVSPILNRLAADKDYFYKSGVRVLQIWAEAEGIRNPLGGKVMRKIASTKPGTPERKELVDMLTGGNQEKVEEAIMSDMDNEGNGGMEGTAGMDYPEEDMSENPGQVEVEEKINMLRKDREVAHTILKNPAMFNIVNTGDILKSLMEYMRNETMRVYLAVNDETKKRIRAEFSC